MSVITTLGNPSGYLVSRLQKKSYLLSLISNAFEKAGGPTLFDLADDGLAPQDVTWSVPFTFVDLFSGIGGMRLGLEASGGQCVFSCEVDQYACKTYLEWFGDNPAGDITELTNPSDIPHHDILAAGFPCQPFSIAGVSKKNSLGREHGFKDQTQGTLFFHLANVIDIHRPPVVLLENVKNLRSHNKGDTWRTIQGTLQQLDYTLFDQVIDAADYVPQHRERVFIVGFDRNIFGDRPPFEFPCVPTDTRPQLRTLLEPDPNPKYTLTNQLWKYLRDYAERHRKKGNGFGFSLAELNGITRTLSARYYKDGSEILIPQGQRKNPRRLTPKEAGRLMGFPERLLNRQAVSDTQAYKQFGNAVVPAVIEAVVRQIAQVFRWQLLRKNGCLLKN